MDIRRCKPDDIDRIMEIEEASFEHPYTELVFYRYFGSELFLVAEEENIIGYIIGDEKEGDGWIISIAVTLSERRRGVGEILMEEVIDKFSRGGLENVSLTVREDNKIAKRFYENMGFETSGLIEEYYRNGDDAILMEKEIDTNC